MRSENKSFKQELIYTKRILADPGETIPALFFSSVDRLICILLRQEQPLSWWISVVALALISQLPTWIISYFFDETQRWREDYLGYFWMGYILLGLSAIVIARVGVFYLFKNINEYVVDKIQRKEDLKDLQKILSYVWLREGSIKKVLYFTLVFTAFWSVSFSTVYANFLKGDFIGFGLFSGTIVFGVLAGPALYMEAWFFVFIIHIGKYKFHLNEVAPVYSEAIQRLSRTITALLYSFAIFIAFSTSAVSYNPITKSFNPLAVLLVTLIGWLPTIIYFIGSQISISRIIVSAKWKTLNRIQGEIQKINKSDITNKENIEAINRLMDYHTSIRITPDSTLSLGTGLNFANQLALPLIGLLLANTQNILAGVANIRVILSRP